MSMKPSWWWWVLLFSQSNKAKLELVKLDKTTTTMIIRSPGARSSNLRARTSNAIGWMKLVPKISHWFLVIATFFLSPEFRVQNSNSRKVEFELWNFAIGSHKVWPSKVSKVELLCATKDSSTMVDESAGYQLHRFTRNCLCLPKSMELDLIESIAEALSCIIGERKSVSFLPRKFKTFDRVFCFASQTNFSNQTLIWFGQIRSNLDAANRLRCLPSSSCWLLMTTTTCNRVDESRN